MGLGIALQDLLGLGSAMEAAPDQSEPAPTMPKISRGQMIAGIIADALAGAAGRPGPFAAMMQRRNEQEQEEANWGRRLEKAEQIKARYREPDVSPMERDLSVWSRLTPEQKQAYNDMQRSRQGDPDIFTTLPNGQFYAGPRSGLAAALTGQASPPERPAIGTRVPLNGGPTPPASGGFPRPY